MNQLYQILTSSVIDAPDVDIVISQEPERRTKMIIEGDKVTFTCSVKRSNPEPDSFTWLKDRKYIDTKQKTVVKIIRPEDSGNYTCSAKNKVGSGSKTLQLIVQCKFYISVFHMSINIAEKIIIKKKTSADTV